MLVIHLRVSGNSTRGRDKTVEGDLGFSYLLGISKLVGIGQVALPQAQAQAVFTLQRWFFIFIYIYQIHIFVIYSY